MRPAVAGVAFLLLLPLPGCLLAAAAAAGAAAVGVVSYENNEAWMDYHATLPEAWSAATRAMRNLGYQVPDRPAPTDSEGVIEAEGVKVTVQRQPNEITRVRARVGTFDTDENERRAKLILEEVRKLLPAS